MLTSVSIMAEFVADVERSVALAVPSASNILIDVATVVCVDNQSMVGVVATVVAALADSSGSLVDGLTGAVADGAIFAVAGGVNHTATAVIPYYKAFSLPVAGPVSNGRLSRRAVLTNDQRQELAGIMLARLAMTLGVEPSILGNLTLVATSVQVRSCPSRPLLTQYSTHG